MAKRHIPTRVDEITPAWLTAALREHGVLQAARVEALEAEILGEGEGFVGRIARLHLRFDRPEAGLPQTLIAKLPTSVRSNRAAGELLGLYEREILFYEELAAHVTLRTPRTYYAAMDPNPGSQYGPAIVRFLERQPAWLLSPQLALYGWLAGLSRRRYLLLMEDLKPARRGLREGLHRTRARRERRQPDPRGQGAGHLGAQSPAEDESPRSELRQPPPRASRSGTCHDSPAAAR